MDRGVGAAVRSLPESDRKDLAIQALAGPETISDLAARHGMSRKFVYQQTHKARAALDDAFSPATPDAAVLFELAVTKTWLRQVIVALPLICRSSYRGVIEFLRDLLGLSVSLGCVHDVLQAATRQASAVNAEQDLSGIRVGLHDEIFQGSVLHGSAVWTRGAQHICWSMQCGHSSGVQAPASDSTRQQQWPPRSPVGRSCAIGAHHR